MRSIPLLRNMRRTGNRNAILTKDSTKPFNGTSTAKRGGNRCSSARAGIEGYRQDAWVPQMKIVIIGAGGRLGSALMREYRDNFDVVGLNYAQLDLSS